ncbi:MAG: Tryptophan synthase alpha chain [Labilithrix sp.]|nr:Tryptophan synthase alpha chain [Labilithrix sp.]
MIRAGLDRAASAVLAAGAIAIVCGGLASCAEAIEIGYQDNDAGIDAGGIFTPPPPDAGDGGLVAPGPQVPLCASTECPWPYVSCIFPDGTLPAYACETNVGSDTLNCGGCGVQCEWGPPTFHLYPTCIDGECKVNCVQGFFDCNGITDDGCEAELVSDPNNCGACGNKCAPGVHCIDGACGCPQGMTECDGACVDLKNSDNDCGQCGFSCRDNPPDGGAPPPNMFYGCKEGQCKDLRCIKDKGADWTDCNSSIDPDGCEVNLAQPDPNNCGKCGNKCDPDEKCFSQAATGIACQCQGNTTYCPGSFFPNYRPETCADFNSDPNNCGSCGYVCPFVQNATPTCTNGRCGYRCNEGSKDCNGNTLDGCEANLKGDPLNCGGCGIECEVGQPCAAGQCATKECAPGETK